nr:NADH-plastoquinone oxidoreductase subunit 6 [Cymbaria mongolica]UYS85105.1 NADH-plastoquinone oxidoreductase subunit 6 [Cymbaria mongolica]
MWELELIPIYLLVSMWGGKNVCTQLKNLFCTRQRVLFFF